MLRGVVTTLSLVSALGVGAWVFSEQSRMATAATTEVASAKADQLPSKAATRVSNGDTARIEQAHFVAMRDNASDHFMTVSQPGGTQTTILVRVPIRQ